MFRMETVQERHSLQVWRTSSICCTLIGPIRLTYLHVWFCLRMSVVLVFKILADYSSRISVVMVRVWKYLWHYLIWYDLIWEMCTDISEEPAFTVFRIHKKSACKGKKMQITIPEKQKPGLYKMNYGQQCTSTGVCEGSCVGMWRVVWWYVKGHVLVREGSCGRTWRVAWWYMKGRVVVREGSCGGTWRVVWWYVKGRVVVDEGSRGGTWRVVWWYVKGNLMVHKGRSICTQRVVWWYMKLFFFNCFECMKLKDNICKFQYSRSTTILFEYLCRFSYII